MGKTGSGQERRKQGEGMGTMNLEHSLPDLDLNPGVLRLYIPLQSQIAVKPVYKIKALKYINY